MRSLIVHYTPNIYDDHYYYYYDDDDDDDDDNNNNNNNIILLYIYNCQSYINFGSNRIRPHDHIRQTQQCTKLYFIDGLYRAFRNVLRDYKRL